MIVLGVRTGWLYDSWGPVSLSRWRDPVGLRDVACGVLVGAAPRSLLHQQFNTHHCHQRDLNLDEWT